MPTFRLPIILALSPRHLLHIGIGLLLGFLSGKLWHVVTVTLMNLEGRQQFFGYHFHHSLLALIPLLFLTKTGLKHPTALLLLSMSIGIILEHRLTYGAFLFITRLNY